MNATIMVRQAILYAPDADGPRTAWLKVAGRPLLVRAMLTAVRAGVTRIGVPAVFGGADGVPTLRASPALAEAIVPMPSGASAWADAPTLLLPSTALMETGALRAMLEAPLSPGGSVLEESKGTAAPVAVLPPELMADLWPRLAVGGPLGDELDGRLRAADVTLVASRSAFTRVTDARLAAEAEAVLYGRLRIDADSSIDRHLHRRCSRALTRYLVRWGLTPNQITVASLLIGLAAAGCLWGATSAGLAVVGLVLYAVSVIVDHADGDVARLTLQESVTGERLDIASDTVVHALLVLGMGAAAARQGAGGAAVLGAAAAAGVILSAVIARLLPARDGGFGTVLRRFGARDLFYVLLGLFAIALATAPWALRWVLVLVAAGSQGYWVAALGATLAQRRLRRRGPRQPPPKTPRQDSAGIEVRGAAARRTEGIH